MFEGENTVSKESACIDECRKSIMKGSQYQVWQPTERQDISNGK